MVYDQITFFIFFSFPFFPFFWKKKLGETMETHRKTVEHRREKPKLITTNGPGS